MYWRVAVLLEFDIEKRANSARTEEYNYWTMSTAFKKLMKTHQYTHLTYLERTFGGGQPDEHKTAYNSQRHTREYCAAAMEVDVGFGGRNIKDASTTVEHLERYIEKRSSGDISWYCE